MHKISSKIHKAFFNNAKNASWNAQFIILNAQNLSWNSQNVCWNTENVLRNIQKVPWKAQNIQRDSKNVITWNTQNLSKIAQSVSLNPQNLSIFVPRPVIFFHNAIVFWFDKIQKKTDGMTEDRE